MENKKNTAPEAPAQGKDPEPVKNENLAASTRFSECVLKEFTSNVSGDLRITDYQRQLVQGYFICIDRALKIADDGRMRKNKNNSDHKWDENTPVDWNHVNMTDLAMDVVYYARMGLDMMQDNMLFPIPYKNNKTNLYDITMTKGYNGIRYIAEKYAVEAPAAVTTELVYKNDTFKPIKKSGSNPVESYEFEITNPFDRGEVVGGFGFIEYADRAKNNLVIMSKVQIDKRKPKKASAEFWGGKKTEWVDGKKTEVEVPGWYEEMAYKTLVREVCGSKHIPVDPKKVDDAYQYMKMREARYAELEAQADIDANANGNIIDTDLIDPNTPPAPMISSTSAIPPTPAGAPNTDPMTGEVLPPSAPKTLPASAPAPVKEGKNGQMRFDEHPDF